MSVAHVIILPAVILRHMMAARRQLKTKARKNNLTIALEISKTAAITNHQSSKQRNSEMKSPDYKNFSFFMSFMLRFIFGSVGNAMCAEKKIIQEKIDEEKKILQEFVAKTNEQYRELERLRGKLEKAREKMATETVSQIFLDNYYQDVASEYRVITLLHGLYDKSATSARNIWTLELKTKDVERSAVSEVLIRINATTSFVAALAATLSLFYAGKAINLGAVLNSLLVP